MIITTVNTTVHVETAEFVDLPTSYVIDVANSQAVNNADATCPSIVSVQNRFRYICQVVFKIQYRIYSLYGSYLHMLHESAY